MHFSVCGKTVTHIQRGRNQAMLHHTLWCRSLILLEAVWDSLTTTVCSDQTLQLSFNLPATFPIWQWLNIWKIDGLLTRNKSLSLSLSLSQLGTPGMLNFTLRIQISFFFPNVGRVEWLLILIKNAEIDSSYSVISTVESVSQIWETREARTVYTIILTNTHKQGKNTLQHLWSSQLTAHSGADAASELV